MKNTLTVTELNQYIKLVLDNDPLVSTVYVKGEISNYKRHSSGHLYFTLKDENAAVSAVMFRGDAGKLKYEPENGMKVLAHGHVSVFPRDGKYQIYIDGMTPDGVGDLFVAFEQLKKKLELEGLFDASRKKAIPLYPAKIALITSPTGAAVRDMLRILKRRYPVAKVLVCPVRVQGDGAADEISAMIRYISKTGAVDLIITGRGGGSIEDLWPFNEECVARAIADSSIPIISAVGHEPDVTIADFVADLRAATPSNGAELAVPDMQELLIRMKNMDIRMTQAMQRKLEMSRHRLEAAAARGALQSPTGVLNEKRLVLDAAQKQIVSSLENKMSAYRRRFAGLAAAIEAMSPLKVLSRGYAIPLTDAKRSIVSVNNVSAGDRLTLRIADGTLGCIVDEVARLS